MKVTYYGHACFGVETGSDTLLFDPFISHNELAKDIDVDSIKTDYVLLSHGHQDHVADAATIATNNDATLVSNFEVVSWFAQQGVEKGHPMNHGGSWNFDFGKVKYVNAVHTSSMPDGSYGGNPGGFVVTAGDKCFYYAGDTALTYDMKLLADSHSLDFAFLPIGDNFTMGIEDAVLASQFINCQKVIGMHYDTFGYIKIDHEAAVAAFAEVGVELILMDIGQTLEIH